MITEGFRKSAHCLMLLIAGLGLSEPVLAQNVFTVLPRMTAGDENPVTFMRPYYAIHVAAGSSQSAPPSTAFAPSQMRHAYGFDQVNNQGAGQVIAVVDAYDDPNVESDLAVFDVQFGLPACTSSNGCFLKIYSTGAKPAENANWDVEIALDVEWAHAIAPKATIVLVETPSNSLTSLLAGVDVAVKRGASAVSMSWTVGEFAGENAYDNHFVASGVTFFAASGDNGTGVAYPAASPDVVGVGGTSLHLDAKGNYLSETAWSGSGGGLSKVEREPLFQAQLAIPDDPGGYRGAPDVAYDGDPGTGVAIYDSVGISGYAGWFQVGGTSAGTPQWAALVAIVNSLRAAARKADLSGADADLYSLATTTSADFHSVTQGSNGSCGALCTATSGYDYVTGLGTPQAAVLVSALASR